MRSRCLRVVTAMGVVVCVASGCTGKPDESPGASRTPVTTTPATTPTTGVTSTSATPATPSTTVARVSLPPAATAHTEQGAKAFVAFFVQQMGKSAYLADSSVIAALSGPRCKGCKVLIDYADQLKAKDHHVDRQSVILRGQIVFPNSTTDNYMIDALIEDLPSKIVDSQGRTVSTQAGEKFTLRNTVSWSSGAWVISENLLVMS